MKFNLPLLLFISLVLVIFVVEGFPEEWTKQEENSEALVASTKGRGGGGVLGQMRGADTIVEVLLSNPCISGWLRSGGASPSERSFNKTVGISSTFSDLYFCKASQTVAFFFGTSVATLFFTIVHLVSCAGIELPQRYQFFACISQFANCVFSYGSFGATICDPGMPGPITCYYCNKDLAKVKLTACDAVKTCNPYLEKESPADKVWLRELGQTYYVEAGFLFRQAYTCRDLCGNGIVESLGVCKITAAVNHGLNDGRCEKAGMSLGTPKGDAKVAPCFNGMYDDLVGSKVIAKTCEKFCAGRNNENSCCEKAPCDKKSSI